ncbi:MAG: hypothetical protein FWG46_05580 [Treponema sp.]|nr:hypothetical protein [Treponema sp.]
MQKKSKFVFLILLFVLINFSNCVDYASDSTIDIFNNSSYNLRLTFFYNIQKTNNDPEYWEPFNIDIEKDLTLSFGLFGGLGSTVAPNPNWEFARVIFYNLNDKTILSDIEICDFDTIVNNLFQLIKTEDYKYSQKAFYFFEITDDLFNNKK